MDLPPIMPDQRVDFIGKTGSGKTFLAHKLLLPVRRLIVLDAKGKLYTDDWRLEPWDANSKALQTLDEPFRYRVPMPYNGDWTPYLWAGYEARNCTFYIDEVYGIEQGTVPSDALRAAITRGREWHVGVWCATQRPKDIPMIILSECEWIFQFQLRLDRDRQRMAEIIGPAAYEKLTGHQVIVFNDEMEEAVKFNQVNVSITKPSTPTTANLTLMQKIGNAFTPRRERKERLMDHV